MHKPEFGVLDYIASYPEVAFLGISPIEHYERFGKRLGYKAPTRITKNVNSLNVSDHENCPLVTVVVPVYDRTWMFRDAINSVLNQDYPNIEIIIVLDGSPQETRAIAKEFANLSNVRIFSFPLPSGNAVRGRNKGIIEARGTFIAFLDSDDIATPQRIRLSVELLQSSGADVVYGAGHPQ